MKAKWIHDCDQCKYIGSMFHHGEILDWYVCFEALVARRGDDGPDYWSMPVSMIKNDDYLIGRDMDNFTAINDMQLLGQAMIRRAG
jgi:hypothetical protein